MRGHVEESEEKKACRALGVAARKYAAAYLSDMFGGEVITAEGVLFAASVAYAKTQRPRKRSVPTGSEGGS